MFVFSLLIKNLTFTHLSKNYETLIIYTVHTSIINILQAKINALLIISANANAEHESCKFMDVIFSKAFAGLYTGHT